MNVLITYTSRHTLNLALPLFLIILKREIPLPAHVLSGDLDMILAPVGLAQLQQCKLICRIKIVTVVEHGDFTWL